MNTSIETNEKVVRGIIAEELCVSPEQLVPSASLIEDLGADSLALTNIVMALEEEFEITVPDSAWKGLKTIGDVTAYVREKTPSQERSIAATANHRNQL